MTICKNHPGGSADLPEANFYPSDLSGRMPICKACRARMAKARTKKQALQSAPTAIAVAELATPVHGRLKVGGYYLHPDCILIVDTLQDGKVVLHTSIIEIEPESKHPRNKKLIFTRQHAPAEYAAIVAWLGGNAPAVADPEREAALQLADEATQKLIAAEARIKDLEAAIAPLRALMGK